VTNQWSDYCVHLNEEISFKHQNSIQKGIFKGIKSNGLASVQIADEIIDYPSIILE
jgi:biotin-(acetyl-CoA carboxylase) ligase